MTEGQQKIPDTNSPSSDEGNAPEDLLQLLRRKEGNWVQWGQACQQLQKAKYTPQTIFEETGFEPIQQNQIIVAAQVYKTMVQAEVSEAVRSHFEHRGSDILYELRVLNQEERATAAEVVHRHTLDAEGTKNVVKAMKEFSYLSSPPEGFTDCPGDAVAYQCWKLARQQADLQARSRLIARGLRFADSLDARQQLEKLLTDFTIEPTRPAPHLPVYRLESTQDLPRILPVAGKFPLKVGDFKTVPLIEEIPPFQMVKFAGEGAWVAIPGWQAILSAEDPVAILCDSNQLPLPPSAKVEEVLVTIDRSQRQWTPDSYFVFAQDEELKLAWFETKPPHTLLGKVILVLRPKKIFDENVSLDPWQIDE